MHDDATTHHTTGPESHDEGVALVLKAEEDGDWKPVIEWLARNPDRANALAEFLATQRGLAVAVAPHVGRPRIDGFELLEEIGRGTFGVVYRAYDSALRRSVAVKLVQVSAEA